MRESEREKRVMRVSEREKERKKEEEYEGTMTLYTTYNSRGNNLE